MQSVSPAEANKHSEGVGSAPERVGSAPESSPEGSSQSNGIAERAVQSVEGQVRTMKLALERRVSCKIPVDHKIMTWMVESAADLLNKFLESLG